MSTECYPMSVLPHTTRLFREYMAMGERGEGTAGRSAVQGWFGAEPFGLGWTAGRPVGGVDRERLANSLHSQAVHFAAGQAALQNIAKLRAGARAVVTGQQVGLFGGPLLTLLKAATAVSLAKQATAATGGEYVPVFWLATEDHDLAEVDQVTLPGKHGVETLRGAVAPAGAVPVGGMKFRQEVAGLLERAGELLGCGAECELLRECYAPGATMGTAFARMMSRVFREQGLIVIDAAGREFHAMGAPVLRAAIEREGELEEALLARTAELERQGYHAQVLVTRGASLLFLVDEETGQRLGLRRSADGGWKAGGRTYTSPELLEILDTAPERLSPNALLRPVFQDAILPTAAYVGGPAEIAYFAQSAVVYQRVLGRVTPVLPRLSATLIEPGIGAVMDRYEVSVLQVIEARTADELAERVGARAMPIEGKRRLAAAGNAMDLALSAAEEYLGGLDESLGRSARVSGSKMRYQMNRLRRLAATFEVQKEASLRTHAEAMVTNLFPDGHPQERVLAGVWFLAKGGDGLVARLVEEAGRMCGGHAVLRL